jgi:capsular polysaccharide export protein
VTKLILHVGQSKTGTTTIQDFLWNCRKDLIREGILYPDTGRQRRAHHKIAALFLGRSKAPDWIVKEEGALLKAELMSEISGARPHTVILSSEVFFACRSLENLKAWFPGFDIAVVLILRRQDRWANSYYQQQLKTGKTGLHPAAWLENRLQLLDYAHRAGRLADAFGDAAVRIGAFERHRFENGLLTYFFHVAGIRTEVELRDPAVRNERLSRDALEYLRAATDTGLGRARRRSLRLALEDYSRLHPDPAKWQFFFSPEERLAILQACREGNAAVARRFLARPDGVLFEDHVIEPEFAPYPGLGAEAAARIREFISRRGV